MKKERELERRIARLEASQDIQVGGGGDVTCQKCEHRYCPSVEFHGSCDPEKVKMMAVIKADSDNTSEK